MSDKPPNPLEGLTPRELDELMNENGFRRAAIAHIFACTLAAERRENADLKRNYARAVELIKLVERERDSALQKASDNGATASILADKLLKSEQIVAMITSEMKVYEADKKAKV